MPVKQKILRSSVASSRPASGFFETGELFVNFADRQLGVIDASQDAKELIAVRFFSTTGEYQIGDAVLQGITIYIATVANGPGPFTPANWDAFAPFAEFLAGYAAGGTHIEYTGNLNNVNFNSMYAINASDVSNEPVDFAGERGLLTTSIGSTGDGISNQFLSGLTNSARGKVWMRNEQSSLWGDWKLIADGGAFTTRLAGLLDTGITQNYAASMDAVLTNSIYSVDEATTTGGPVEFNNNGILITNLNSGGPDNIVQRLIGMLGDDEGSQWQRSRTAGVWGAWTQQAGGDVTTPEQPNHTKAGNTQLWNGTATNPGTFNCRSLGANGDHIVSSANWGAMSNIPAGARAVIVSVYGRVHSNSVNPGTTLYLYTGPEKGVALVVNDSSKVFSLEKYNAVEDRVTTQNGEIIIPLGSSNNFRYRWSVSNSGSRELLTLAYKGFIMND